MSMEYIANGFPKSGTHALLKALELLGAGSVSIAHHPYGWQRPPESVHMCIFRHPRNCLISMCRFQGFPVVTGYLLKLIQSYGTFGRMADCLSGFLPWRSEAGVLCITYEDLMASDASLREIAEFAGLPFLDDAFRNLPGLTKTWSGKPSQWIEYWNPILDEAWASSGMLALEKELGY